MPAQRRHFRAEISAPNLIKGFHRLGGGWKGVRSPLFPELTLLQSSEHPSHSWGCSSLPPCPGCTHPGGLTSCRGQAGLALPLPRSEGWQHTEGQGWNIQRDGFPSHAYRCQYTPSPCCLPPHPKGGKNQCDRLDLTSRLEPRSPAALPTITLAPILRGIRGSAQKGKDTFQSLGKERVWVWQTRRVGRGEQTGVWGVV